MKRSFLRALVGTTAIVGAAMVALPNDADAVPIIEGNSAALSVSGSDGGVNVGLDGTVLFEAVATNSLKFVFDLTNTGDEDPDSTVLNENRISAFGFSIDGVFVDIDDADADGTWDATNNVPGNSFLNVDVCVYQGSTCTGGANTGIFVGDNALIGVTLTGTFTPPLDFAAFGARFQSTGPNQRGSLKLVGDVSTPPPPPPPTDAPEPASLALLGVGLLGLGYATRRRRQAV